MRECLSNALAAWSEQDYPTALKEYLKNLIMAPEQERLDKYQEQFAKLLAQASAAGVVFDDRNKRLQNEIFPKSPLVLWTMGNLVMANDPFESLSLYGKAASLSGGLDLVNALGSILACRSTIVSTWHISMVNDDERNQKFNMALSRIVTPNSRVIDIGAGTGLLSMFASRYTNERVTGLEGEMPMAQLGQRCVEWNGLGQRVVIHPVMSSVYTPSQPPDVVVSETMDAGGLGEKILQIFHDVHTRYKGGDPSHRITFCPSKLTFFVVLIQSDKFWLSRMHRHNCQEFGCDDTCFIRQYNTSLLSDHDVLRSVETSYTTIDTEDFDDLMFLSDHIQILTTPLDSEQFLSDLKMLNITAGNFKVPITTAGRADAVLMCWRATLAPGIELESVRRGGWDYAAYPLSARTQYGQGDTFFGEWVVNFEQGIAINHIMDPDTTPGAKESMRGPYDEYLFKKDDGTIEMVNNESLRRFLSTSSPSRLSSWLSSRGQDSFFPVTTEGTLQFQYLETACNQRRKGIDLDFDTITSVRAYGCLFRADHINSCARQNQAAQQGVDLQLLDEFALPEYREIRGVDSGDGRFQMLSSPLLLIDLDPRRDYEAIVTGEQCQATVLDCSSADGILYWWVLNGEWSNREAGLPLAAFLFNKREQVEQGQTMRFNVFLKDSEFIISYGPGMITASAEDAEAAAPAAVPTVQQAAPPAYPAARATDV
ncbi:hypothetical protein PENTCL1PPCAC_18999 [Pristionchus entomophagus]|uniref:Protein arginine N-methyltransferase 6 n=1 Tax=Pristionchus entomophagus TaxID=358040 RepID=A0AAV5TQV8_9BILA|nr:hypothetical protein PENTCL1PPCAC_18999 [Pristionchus entomophagus]